MKLFFKGVAAGMLLFLAAVPGFGQQKKLDRLEQSEDRRFEAMSQRDTALLRTMLSGDLVYTHSNGLVETREQHLSNIAAGTIVYESMVPESRTFRLYGKSARVSGIVQVKGLYKGNSFQVRLRYLAFYVRNKGKWQLSAWQSLSLAG